MANEDLRHAKRNKNDEFYTQYSDIQKEINAYLEYDPDAFRGKTVLLPCDDPEWSNFTKFFAQNFEMFGLKKLISTSYALDSKRKRYKYCRQLEIFETEAPQYDPAIDEMQGKKFILERDINNSGRIDIDDLEFDYLKCDGDFRSEEVKKLRDEADMIITNPPFSMFREFFAWVIEAGKKFLIIGNKNAVTYKEIFPLFMQNKIWMGATCNGRDMVFGVPEGAEVSPSDKAKAEKLGYKGNYTRLGNACWITNLEHGRRHEPLMLMTMADNLKYSKHKEIRANGYPKYDNYAAIEVPFTDAIPDDYEGVMGVPITFLDKYCPEQYEIIGMSKTPLGNHLRTKIYGRQIQHGLAGSTNVTKLNDGAALLSDKKPEKYPFYEVDGKYYTVVYPRILIRKRAQNENDTADGYNYRRNLQGLCV